MGQTPEHRQRVARPALASDLDKVAAQVKDPPQETADPPGFMGEGLAQLFLKSIPAGRQCDVQLWPAGILPIKKESAVEIRHVQKLDLVCHTQIVQIAIQTAPTFWRTNTRQFVQGNLKLVTSANKASSIAAGNIMPLQQQNAQTIARQDRRGR